MQSLKNALLLPITYLILSTTSTLITFLNFPHSVALTLLLNCPHFSNPTLKNMGSYEDTIMVSTALQQARKFLCSQITFYSILQCWQLTNLIKFANWVYWSYIQYVSMQKRWKLEHWNIETSKHWNIGTLEHIALINFIFFKWQFTVMHIANPLVYYYTSMYSPNYTIKLWTKSERNKNNQSNNHAAENHNQVFIIC